MPRVEQSVGGLFVIGPARSLDKVRCDGAVLSLRLEQALDLDYFDWVVVGMNDKVIDGLSCGFTQRPISPQHISSSPQPNASHSCTNTYELVGSWAHGILCDVCYEHMAVAPPGVSEGNVCREENQDEEGDSTLHSVL